MTDSALHWAIWCMFLSAFDRLLSIPGIRVNDIRISVVDSALAEKYIGVPQPVYPLPENVYHNVNPIVRDQYITTDILRTSGEFVTGFHRSWS